MTHLLDSMCLCLVVLNASQVNAAFPFNNRDHGAPSLSLLQILSVNIHPKIEILWDKEIPPLLSILEGMETCGHEEAVLA